LSSSDLRLPAAADNLFQRLIRNPRPDSPHARERECTEMLDEARHTYPQLMVGIECAGDSFVRLETAPNHELKSAVRRAIASVADDLATRNKRWVIPPADEAAWIDTELRMPLVDLLSAEDQEDVFVDFVRGALTDLAQAGVIDAIGEELR
jgi:hypothetical protein